jgi:sodium transport system ATP-binding protein
MIEARQLTKTFKDKKRGLITAVADVSFTCSPGRIYGLLGANGAGKTTTLRLLATLLKPASGTITVRRLPRRQHRALRAPDRAGNGDLLRPAQRHDGRRHRGPSPGAG